MRFDRYNIIFYQSLLHKGEQLMLYTYSFADRKRDLSQVMSGVIKDEPRFISNFHTVSDATNRKHEYLQDQLTGRGITVTAVNDSTLTLSASDAAKLHVGTLIALKDDPALYRIDSVGDSSAAVSLVSANGSNSTVLPAAGGNFIIVSTPMAEGSVNGDGEENYHLSESAWNATQIFRKEIVLSGSALAVSLYGNADNQLNRQTCGVGCVLVCDFSDDKGQNDFTGGRGCGTGKNNQLRAEMLFEIGKKSFDKGNVLLSCA